MGGIERSPAAAAAKPGLRDRLREELREFAIIAAYLWVWFFVLMLFKSAVLREAGVHLLPLGLALAKALILAKFLLIARSAARFTLHPRSLFADILLQSLLCLLLLLALTAVEEIIVGWVRGHSVLQTLAEYEQRSLFEMIVESVLLLLVLVPLVALKVCGRALGPEVVTRLLSGSRADAPD